MGVFVIPPLPPVLAEELRTAGPLGSARVTPPRRYYGPIRHPLAVGRLPGVAGYMAYPASAVSGRDEEGFSSCSTCPCRHAVANTEALRSQVEGYTICSLDPLGPTRRCRHDC